MEQQTQEWLKMRKTKIGASDAPVLMQVSPWKSPYMLWQEKLDLVPSQPKSEAMQRGIDLEQKARSLFTIETGISIEPKVIISKEYEWMMASFDGVSYDNKIAVEIKCPGSLDHNHAIDGEVPEKYIPQLQHQMFVLGIDMIMYCSYHPKHIESFVFFKHERDDEYIKKMLEEEKSFYECMKTKTPPKLSDRDYAECNDKQFISSAIQWREVNKKLKELEAEEAALRKNLINIANDKNVIGGGVKMSKIIKKGSIDYSAIETLKQIDLEKYRKSDSTYWKLTAS